MNLKRLNIRPALALAVAYPMAANAGTFTTLYTFTGTKDAGSPVGRLVYLNGTLYGVASGNLTTPHSNGVVFALNIATRALKVLYRFEGGADGEEPIDLTYHGGTFYGTTVYGGAGCENQGCGTVFAFDAKTRTETILYEFPEPVGPGHLLYKSGTLFGTARLGGASGDGAVFAIDLQSGAEKTLYSFTGNADGGEPAAALLLHNGLLYGTTYFGGGKCDFGCGTVFSLDPSDGTETVLHGFEPGKGGSRPYDNLVYDNGLIYGATLDGGDNSCGRDGCGTLFSINPQTAAESTVYTMTSKHETSAALTARGKYLYETVVAPTRNRKDIFAGGLVKFNLKTAQRKVIYTFNEGSRGADGADPDSPLLYVNGTFYGTTPLGGSGGQSCNNEGCGTIFQYVP
ncbi:MAG TPA: choice-of-anchor tandem repeat GloVer-containing protein [Acetobacteraceae bacterium]|nr:choice-of-anchor tandem repeat GloVer-containing protein [Acetobacteraceae bacterium]